MCYTSGTTGNPKGVVYSHRSAVLHSLITLTADGFGLHRAGRGDAGGADVPRQRLGAALRRLMAGTDLVLPGPRMTPAGIVGAAGPAPGHRHRRGADDLDGRAAAAGRPRPVGVAGDPLRRLGGAQGAVGELPQGDRHPDAARLGHDRDQPDRHRLPPAERARRPDRGRAGRRARPAGAAGAAGRPAGRRPGHRRAAALGRRRPPARSSWPARGSPGSTTGARAAAPSSPRTAGCAPATSPRSTGRATSGWSTGPRT